VLRGALLLLLLPLLPLLRIDVVAVLVLVVASTQPRAKVPAKSPTAPRGEAATHTLDPGARGQVFERSVPAEPSPSGVPSTLALLLLLLLPSPSSPIASF
jgi:hypothetical protein